MFKQAAAYLGWVFYVIIMAGGVVAGGGAYHTTGDWHRALQAGAITTFALAAALLAVHAVWRLQLRDGEDERPNLRGTRFEHVNKRTLAWQLDECVGGISDGQATFVAWASYLGVFGAGAAAAGFMTAGLVYDPAAVGILNQAWAAAAMSAAAFLMAGFGLLVRRYRR